MIPAMANLTEKMDQMAELRAKLEASLALAGFEPRAFEHGACKVGARGNIRYAAEHAVWHVTLGNGERIEHPLLETPIHLWPPTAREEWESLTAYDRRRALARFNGRAIP